MVARFEPAASIIVRTLDPLFEGLLGDDAVRKPLAALVEDDDPGEGVSRLSKCR
jgi:hypothetical protein